MEAKEILHDGRTRGLSPHPLASKAKPMAQEGRRSECLLESTGYSCNQEESSLPTSKQIWIRPKDRRLSDNSLETLSLSSKQPPVFRYERMKAASFGDIPAVQCPNSRGSSMDRISRADFASSTDSEKSLGNREGSTFRLLQSIKAMFTNHSRGSKHVIEDDEDVKASRMTYSDGGTIDMY
jgi:hypothetical protein